MLEDRDKQRFAHAFDTALSGLEGDPGLAWRVMTGRKDEKGGKIPLGLAVCLALLLISAGALAASLLREHKIELFEDVAVKDLLPDQWQQYDVCHRVTDGYLVGGFELGDDFISPMGDEDKILCLDENFSLSWTLEDARLKGCLFDRVKETDDAFYFGTERRKEAWVPSIMKVSKEGEILWIYEGVENEKIKDFIATGQGGVYCAGRNGEEASLFKINQEGALAWRRTFEEYEMTSLNSISPWNENMIAVGQSAKGVVLLIVDAGGDVLSHVSYDLHNQIDAARLRRLADGRLVLVLTVGSESLNEKATAEVKYMTITPEIFE